MGKCSQCMSKKMFRRPILQYSLLLISPCYAMLWDGTSPCRISNDFNNPQYTSCLPVPTLFTPKNPTETPTFLPTTEKPSPYPSFEPTAHFSTSPTVNNSNEPSLFSSDTPSSLPTPIPTFNPTPSPSIGPTNHPTSSPSSMITKSPSLHPIGTTNNPSNLLLLSPTSFNHQYESPPTSNPSEYPVNTQLSDPSEVTTPPFSSIIKEDMKSSSVFSCPEPLEGHITTTTVEFSYSIHLKTSSKYSQENKIGTAITLSSLSSNSDNGNSGIWHAYDESGHILSNPSLDEHVIPKVESHIGTVVSPQVLGWCMDGNDSRQPKYHRNHTKKIVSGGYTEYQSSNDSKDSGYHDHSRRRKTTEVKEALNDSSPISDNTIFLIDMDPHDEIRGDSPNESKLECAIYYTSQKILCKRDVLVKGTMTIMSSTNDDSTESNHDDEFINQVLKEKLKEESNKKLETTYWKMSSEERNTFVEIESNEYNSLHATGDEFFSMDMSVELIVSDEADKMLASSDAESPTFPIDLVASEKAPENNPVPQPIDQKPNIVVACIASTLLGFFFVFVFVTVKRYKHAFDENNEENHTTEDFSINSDGQLDVPKIDHNASGCLGRIVKNKDKTSTFMYNVDDDTIDRSVVSEDCIVYPQWFLHAMDGIEGSAVYDSETDKNPSEFNFSEDDISYTTQEIV